MVNLDPTQPELGTIKAPLRSMHNGVGCECHGVDTNGVPELLINHYLGSVGDYMDRTVRYWEVRPWFFVHPAGAPVGCACFLFAFLLFLNTISSYAYACVLGHSGPTEIHPKYRRGATACGDKS